VNAIRRRRQVRPHRDKLAAVRAVIGRMVDMDGRTVDFDCLDDGEARALLELARRRGGGEPFPESDQRRLETLVERVTGRDGVFEAHRQAKDAAAKRAELEQLAKRPPRRIRYEERGAVILPAELFTQLQYDGERSCFGLEHLGVLLWVAACLENGRNLAPRGRIEGAGNDVRLVIDRWLGLGGRFDEHARLGGAWLKAAQHLARNGWLRVEVSGQNVKIARGPRLLAALKQRRAA